MTDQTTQDSSTQDPFIGMGGSYTVDPETGTKTLAERTAPAPTAQEVIDLARATTGTETETTPEATSEATPQGRFGRSGRNRGTSESTPSSPSSPE